MREAREERQRRCSGDETVINHCIDCFLLVCRLEYPNAAAAAATDDDDVARAVCPEHVSLTPSLRDTRPADLPFLRFDPSCKPTRC